METKFAKYSNNIFKYLTIVCLNFIWLNYYAFNFTQSLIISSVISIIFFIIIEHFLKLKQTKLNTNKLNQSLFEKFKNNCILNTHQENLKLIQSCFNNHLIKTTKNYLLIDEKHILTCDFKTANFTDETFFKIINSLKNLKAETITIFCINMQCETIKNISQINNKKIYVYTLQDLFLNNPNLKNYEFSNTITYNTTQKNNFKTLIKIILDKRNAKKYFFSGLLLLFYSFFIPFTSYYLIFCTILFSLSMLCFFNTNTNSAKTFCPYIFKK